MKERPLFVARPKKSLGQHFLIDGNIQRKILDLAEIDEGEPVVEIGPGRGILTRGLLERGARVLAIEIDRGLSEGLVSSLPSGGTLEVIHADALRYPYATLPAPYKVVANLPYYLSTEILFLLLKERQRITKMVVMLQREVAERMVADVGNKRYGVLSVLLQFYSEVSLSFRVPPTCFRPQPQVDSAVVVCHPLAAPKVLVLDEAYFLRVVKGAFGHRRKQLANALSDHGFKIQTVELAIDEMGVNRSRRGETFSLAEFARFSNTLFKIENKP